MSEQPLSTQADVGFASSDMEIDESMSEAELLEREHSPAERPVAVDDYGTTADEQRRGEPLDARLAREVPEESVDDDQLDEDGGEDEEAGAIVELDEGVREDTEKDAIAYERPGHTGTRSAEEAAMHTFEA